VIYLAYTIHVVVCLFLILVVLLQQGKGADLSVFGGGATQSAFGARGAATLLHKLTVGAFVAFIVTTISIGLMQTGGRGGSVMSTVGEEPAAEPTATEAVDPGDEAPAAETLPAGESDGEGAEGAGDTAPADEGPPDSNQ
jgi:preprotein translocase subunit SecG